MREQVTIEVGESLPETAAVQRGLGYAEDAVLDERIARLFAQALELLAQLAAPVGLLADVSAAEFAPVHEGQGNNESVAPLPSIFPRADSLALMDKKSRV